MLFLEADNMVGNRGESSGVPFKPHSSFVLGQVWKSYPPPPPISLLTGTAAYGGRYRKVPPSAHLQSGILILVIRGESSGVPFKRHSSCLWGQVWKSPPPTPLSLLTGTAAYRGRHGKVSPPPPTCIQEF